MRGSLTTLRAWNRSLTKASDKLWKSPGPRTSMDWTCIFNPSAASWLSFQLAALLIFVGFHGHAGEPWNGFLEEFQTFSAQLWRQHGQPSNVATRAIKASDKSTPNR